MRRLILACALILAALAAGLRIVALDSDPYARLCWSTGLLTDEGFYIHNARNLVLFGQERTDEFNNNLIMPTLHFVQVAVFKTFGVGSVQARSISVAFSLATLAVFFLAMRRAFDWRIATAATAFMGLDHINLLYNRMALMDTPGVFLLVCAFYAFAGGEHGFRVSGVGGDGCRVSGVGEESGHTPVALTESHNTGHSTPDTRNPTPVFSSDTRPPSLPTPATRRPTPETRPSTPVFLLACGAFLGLAFATRGLTAFAIPIPFLLAAGRPNWRSSLLWLACGLGLVILIYFFAWQLPHRTELMRVNAHYVGNQLLPKTLQRLGINFYNAWLGDDRGAAPFLMRHSPVQVLLALAFAASALSKTRKEFVARNWNLSSGFLALWLALALATFSIVNYAPSRYYVLFYPALAGIAALGLFSLPAIWESLRKNPVVRTMLGAYLAYHVSLSILHHDDASRVAGVGICTILGGGAFLFSDRLSFTIRLQELLSVRANLHRTIVGTAALWMGFNSLYLGDWLAHLQFSQRDASHWLTNNLPPDAVLIGDVAPGLCLDNRFKCVPVIKGLCNDSAPFATLQTHPGAILILDGDVKESYWTKNYPEAVSEDKRTRFIPRLVGWPVGIYRVSHPGGETSSQTPLLDSRFVRRGGR